MNWVRFVIDAAASVDPELLSTLLEEAGAAAVSLEDGADSPIFEPAPGETPLWPATRVIGLFPANVDPVAVRRGLESQLGRSLMVHIEPLESRDWVRAWMVDFHPLRFGRRLWVCPSHLSPPEPEAVNIRLDPGLAFGTGTHPTTALCLEWLDAHPPEGLQVLDYGCGSGVLAIAAALLGAARVLAVDIDAQALTATRENARRNKVESIVQALRPEALPDLKVGLILANILTNPLRELAPELAGRAAPGGWLVLSGILAGQAGAIADTYRPWFALETEGGVDGWVRLAGTRRDGEIAKRGSTAT